MKEDAGRWHCARAGAKAGKKRDVWDPSVWGVRTGKPRHAASLTILKHPSAWVISLHISTLDLVTRNLQSQRLWMNFPECCMAGERESILHNHIFFPDHLPWGGSEEHFTPTNLCFSTRSCSLISAHDQLAKESCTHKHYTGRETRHT